VERNQPARGLKGSGPRKKRSKKVKKGRKRKRKRKEKKYCNQKNFYIGALFDSPPPFTDGVNLLRDDKESKKKASVNAPSSTMSTMEIERRK